MKGFNLVEELEFDPATFEDEVDGRHDGLAHAGVHPPHECSAVGEHESEAAVESAAGTHAGKLGVAVLVAEAGVVHAESDGGGGAVAPVFSEPVDHVIVFDGHEAFFEDAIFDHAGDSSEAGVHDDEEAAEVVVIGRAGWR